MRPRNGRSKTSGLCPVVIVMFLLRSVTRGAYKAKFLCAGKANRDQTETASGTAAWKKIFLAWALARQPPAATQLGKPGGRCTSSRMRAFAGALLIALC